MSVRGVSSLTMGPICRGLRWSTTCSRDWVCWITKTMARITAATRVWNTESRPSGNSNALLKTTHSRSRETSTSATNGRDAMSSIMCKTALPGRRSGYCDSRSRFVAQVSSFIWRCRIDRRVDAAAANPHTRCLAPDAVPAATPHARERGGPHLTAAYAPMCGTMIEPSGEFTTVSVPAPVGARRDAAHRKVMSNRWPLERACASSPDLRYSRTPNKNGNAAAVSWSRAWSGEAVCPALRPSGYRPVLCGRSR